MEYEKFDKNTISDDYNEVVAGIELEAWVKFAAAALSDSMETQHPTHLAASIADDMMIKFRERFINEAV